MADVTHFTRPAFIKTLASTEKYAAIEELARVFDGTEICDDIGLLIEALAERERIMSTGIGFSLAIPHAKIAAINKMAFAIGISPHGIPFDSMDGEDVHVVVLVVAEETHHKEYLRLLAKIMAIMKDPHVRRMMVETQSPDDILALLRASAP